VADQGKSCVAFEWPELHAAIREARKAYQADGTMPDWEAFGKASDVIRTATG